MKIQFIAAYLPVTGSRGQDSKEAGRQLDQK